MHVFETKTYRVVLDQNEKLKDVIKKLSSLGYVVLDIRKAEEKVFCQIFDVTVKTEKRNFF